MTTGWVTIVGLLTAGWVLVWLTIARLVLVPSIRGKNRNGLR